MLVHAFNVGALICSLEGFPLLLFLDLLSLQMERLRERAGIPHPHLSA